MTISNQPFGTSRDGSDTRLWTIENSSGYALGLTDWGATIVSLVAPDRDGAAADIVLGFNDVSEYGPGHGYQGATCGRFANRIAGGKFVLDGREYSLACNDGDNHLHGGDRGYDSRLWKADPYTEGDRAGVVFTYVSPDGEENYPGELKVRADYGLDEEGRLYMDFRAECDAATVVNITNHAYWNLAGRGTGTVLDHEIRFAASRYLPVDDGAIPTGEQKDVDGTPFDFRTRKTIDTDIGSIPGGYDHCMVIDGKRGELRKAVEARHPGSGRKLVLLTDRPGVQFYTGNFLTGAPAPKYGGFCLEPQDFPDAPNHKGFPSATLRPGETYHHRTVVEFSAE